MDYMDEKCSQFKDVAKFDNGGNLIISENGKSSNLNNTNFNYNSRFLNNE